MVYRVSFHRRAIADVDRLQRWVNEVAPIQGPIWFRRLMDGIDTLRYLPHRCPNSPRGTSSGRPIKKLLFGRRPNVYRILFTIRKDDILILRIVSAKQDQ